MARDKQTTASDDLFEIASALRDEMKQLSVWQRKLVEGEIHRLQERERILRQIWKYEYSRLPRYIVSTEHDNTPKLTV